LAAVSVGAASTTSGAGAAISSCFAQPAAASNTAPNNIVFFINISSLISNYPAAHSVLF
jgi:hypothetical protein